jgi:serine/threonine protein kinase/tetratricopeptide (TPR) repeat protein
MPPGDSDLASSDATEIGDPGISGRTTMAREPNKRIPQPGDRVGHFIVRDTLGVGGMGVVLRAHDEHLDRTVALKLVRYESDGQETRTHGTERLLIEARAMAKIRHDNVITVHEVGVVDGQVFLAMEYIDGQTLGDWATERSRPWAQIVDRWLEAGRGLAAAHAAGLVHRDFKPANVLVGHDGRVLVTDFGIAGKLGNVVAGLSESSAVAVSTSSTDKSSTGAGASGMTISNLTGRLTDRLTQTGGMLGTPRYMAPEQFLGGAVDERADQFAFCVSLWEAVYGAHPFESSNLAALALAASTGAIRKPPRGRRAPDRLRRVLTRGLSAAPADRYPDIAALLAELVRLRRRVERRRVVIPSLFGAMLVAGAVWAAWPDPPDPCAPPPEGNWVGVWEPEIEAEIEAALREAEVPYVRDSWPRVQVRLADYTHEWDEHQQQACRDTRVRELVSEQLLDRRMSCLDSRARRVAALVGQLRARDVDVVAHALELASQLPSLADCDDLTRLAADTPLPPAELREELDAFDVALAHATTLDIADRGDLAAEHLKPWEPRVLAIGYPLAEAQLHQALGNSWSGRDNPRSCESYRRAYGRAIAADSVDLATKLALQISTCDVDESDKSTDFWLDVAVAGYEQLGREPDAIVYAARAYVFRSRRDLAQAEIEAARSVELANEAADSNLVLKGEANLGAILAEQGKLDEARGHILRAVELATEQYGPNHQITLKWRSNQVALGAMQGKDFSTVVRDAEQLLAEQEAGLGPDADSVAVTLTIMGMSLRQLEQIERATECDARALAIRERVYGPKHWLTLESLEKLARDHISAKQFESGIAELRRAVDLQIELRDPQHIDVGRAWSTLAWALGEATQYEEAIATHRRAIEILVAAVGEEHRSVAEVHGLFGITLVEAGEFGEGEAVLVKTLELAKLHTFAPRTVAEYLFNLSQARRQLHRKDAKAFEPAQQALALLTEQDPEAPLRAEIETWLRDEAPG